MKKKIKVLPIEKGEVWNGKYGCRTWFSNGKLKEIELLESKGGKGKDKIPKVLSAQHRAILLELKEYLAGRRKRFRFEVAIQGPVFFQSVYRCLKEIPYGNVISYGELAALAGRPGAARAVGTAMAKNVFPLVIPCHRVLAAKGAIGGFGSGLGWKRFLLEMERTQSS